MIPTLTTERLTLRVPKLEDFPVFEAYLRSDRSQYVGGPITDRATISHALGHVTGLWILRGYSSFTACLHDGTVIGMFGPWYPITWPEPEFGWSLWDERFEGEGYVTEAMRVLIPWTWQRTDLKTVVAHIHPDNAASMRVAERLGATVDPAAQPPNDKPTVTYRFMADAS
ncbi:GNAT family N-acetyltransferase [Yoonia sp. R2-816]|uniref:GNAT family N-acetyltransferase n=1 Tax=Yoonia sp. R2-816 TaxID=3342638 RepID=UPI0037284ABF